MRQPVYFDCNATTRLAPEVLEAMLPWLSQQHGNPSSRHAYGRAARAAVDQARAQVASLVGAHHSEIVFVSSGSEANNLFIKGLAATLPPGIVAVSAIEHPSVLRPAAQLQRRGWSLHELAVDSLGRIDNAAYEQVLAARPAMVSVMSANNETGVVQCVDALAAQAAAVGAWFHTDAVQVAGKRPVNFRHLNLAGVHAMTLSGHKIHGPKGAAALVVDKRLDLEPLISGGGQERGLRSGTENVAAIVGFGAACERAAGNLVEVSHRLLRLRDCLAQGVADIGATVFGLGVERLSNTVFFALPGIDGETLVGRLDEEGFAVASGAACSGAQAGHSHVLGAMGVAPELARGAVRVSLGAENTQDEVDSFLVALRNVNARLRGLAAVAR